MDTKNRTPGQLRARTAFKLAVAFLSPLQGIIKKGFREKAKRKKSLALSLALGHALQAAILDRDTDPKINPAAILLSEGALAPISLMHVLRNADYIEVKHVDIQNRFVNGDDLITVCVYHVASGTAVVNTALNRREEGLVMVSIPIELQQEVLEVYLVVSDRREKKFARSMHLGRSLPNNVWEK
ncbi:DUF6266 family protein [Sphingobacterium tabacisoli]|uniref:DUF6266 family protein n=1 Tax=Sphingobacterium tabacisoli TaxID=2044855 RepID=A0ABW5LB82_9SPHI|nr:DUF6266 family protein [Sphingobacterium tabacisoli]